jgi:ATP-dependent exoDNAse (exonuclease V) alpha subunit
MPKPGNETPHLELNVRFRRALDLMEHSGKCVFITGRAGTGKSTLLEHFRNITKQQIAVLAPTGVAALNVHGQTIHSFFGFKPGITLEKVRRLRSPGQIEIYNKLDIIIIDEVSMVRADLLDCADRFLRLNGPDNSRPFGGIKMVFIGDLYQLPPVVTGAEKEAFESCYETPYFYSASVFQKLDMDFVELEKVYRQHDTKFIELLNSIRNKSVTKEGLDLLNSRYQPGFEPPDGDFYIYLTTTNQMAREINDIRLAMLDSPLHTFSARIKGDFDKEYLPTAPDLQVKAGAQVMMLNIDTGGRWVNGSVGKIVHIDSCGDEPVIKVELQEGETHDVTPNTWEIFKFYVDEGTLRSESIGSFRQYPIMLAWAVTIHKSQGKTFDKVIIDMGRGAFTHGQTYVALSRCTTLEGIVLKKPILNKHIWADYRIRYFLAKYQYAGAENASPPDEKVELIRAALKAGNLLEIVYLRPDDEKSKRIVHPQAIGEMEYRGKKYSGLKAFCTMRQEERTFRLDRILEIKIIGR